MPVKNRMIQAIAALIFIVQPAAALAKTVDAVLHETTGFVMGYGGPEMALFLNPNSVRGHALYEEMVPYMAHYVWRMYIIPVGFTTQSRLLAAAEIAAPNVQAAIAEDERKFDVLNKMGGYPVQETQKDNPKILEVASIREKDNVKALKALGKAETPCLAWKTNGHWHIRYQPSIRTVKKAAETLKNND